MMNLEVCSLLLYRELPPPNTLLMYFEDSPKILPFTYVFVLCLVLGVVRERCELYLIKQHYLIWHQISIRVFLNTNL